MYIFLSTLTSPNQGIELWISRITGDSISPTRAVIEPLLIPVDLYNIDLGCANCGPRAKCGQRPEIVRPAKGYGFLNRVRPANISHVF